MFQLELGEYHFRSYGEVDRRVNLVATGLTAIGVRERQHVVIFADTREEWMTTAFACFKRNFPSNIFLLIVKRENHRSRI